MKFVLRSALVLMWVAWTSACHVNAGTRGEVLELWFSTGLLGTIEPCGCTSNPLGGLDKIASLLGTDLSERLFVEVGPVLLPKHPIIDFERPQHRLKARLIARAYRRLGVSAVNLAYGDLKEGSELLVQLQKEGAVPFVSANLRPSAAGPEVAQSFLRTLKGVKVGIVGLTSTVKSSSFAESDSVQWKSLDLVEALRREVEQVSKEGADLMVVLANVDAATAVMLAKSVSGIDVILRSPGSEITEVPQLPTRVGSTLLLEAGQQGQYLGRLSFVLQSHLGTKELVFYDAGAKARADRARLERRASAMEKEAMRFEANGQLDVAEARRGIAMTLRSRASKPVQLPPPPTTSYVRFDLEAVTNELRSDRETHKLLMAYYQGLRELNSKMEDSSACQPKTAEDAYYVGHSACKDCHRAAMDFWEKTAHAKAWATLSEAGKHYDVTCVGCHSVGFRKPGGFCSLAKGAAFQNVGCENCHGPGSLHVVAPSKTTIVRDEGKKTCTTCHVPEHSDQFVYEGYLQKVLGPGHGQPLLPP